MREINYNLYPYLLKKKKAVYVLGRHSCFDLFIQLHGIVRNIIGILNNILEVFLHSNKNKLDYVFTLIG